MDQSPTKPDSARPPLAAGPVLFAVLLTVKLLGVDGAEDLSWLLVVGSLFADLIIYAAGAVALAAALFVVAALTSCGYALVYVVSGALGLVARAARSLKRKPYSGSAK